MEALRGHAACLKTFSLVCKQYTELSGRGLVGGKTIIHTQVGEYSYRS